MKIRQIYENETGKGIVAVDKDGTVPGYYTNEYVYCLEDIIKNMSSNNICPFCGGEVLINKYSGNGFCIDCDYKITL